MNLICRLIFSMSLLCAVTAYADCGVYQHCGKIIERESKPLHPGCETLDVTIHNTTAFQLVIDSNYHPGSTVGDTSNFTNIDPNATLTFPVSGVKVDSSFHQDEVDTSIRYIAKRKNSTTGNDNVGTQFTITLKKDSCNSSSAVLNMSDYRCYYDCRVCFIGCSWGGCAIGSVGYSGGQYCDVTCLGQTEDGVCKSYYNSFVGVNCKNASQSPLENMSSNSSVKPDPGLYTVGANLDANGSGMGENNTTPFSTYSNFSCDQSSECGKTSDCKGGTSDHNKTAKLEFYVKASPIEALTLTFPFNAAQSSVAKVMFNAIYSNLNATYLAKLSTYFSVRPVVMTETTLAFATLCNSANCPSPP